MYNLNNINFGQYTDLVVYSAGVMNVREKDGRKIRKERRKMKKEDLKRRESDEGCKSYMQCISVGVWDSGVWKNGLQCDTDW